jgi:hypothetical protein
MKNPILVTKSLRQMTVDEQHDFEAALRELLSELVLAELRREARRHLAPIANGPSSESGNGDLQSSAQLK